MKSIYKFKVQSIQKLRKVLIAIYGLKDKKVIHFIHISKTGGTSIKTALNRHLYVTNRYLICLHTHNFRLKDIPIGDGAFFFLRDPISRFISSFYSRKRMGKPRYNIPWSVDEEIAFSHFSTPNELALALSAKDVNIQNSAISAMKSIKHVNSSYSDWFDSKDYFLSRLTDIKFIGFQESLEQDFTNLRKILYLPKVVKLPQDATKAHRSPSHLDTYLEDKAKQNLLEWYVSDYEFFELCQEQAKKINSESLLME